MTHLLITLRLHFRNRMALVYSYLFPAIFLLAFWVLYRHERVPLVRHMGELLTVTVLGSACFGLPTSIVSERERGVWRRYRLAPVSTGRLVATTTAARYLILLTAGALQLALAMGLGMPWPRHPFDLWVVFTLVAFAFIGLGLVIAMTADTVPAVQALGQCVFLPMLIIGGVAVPLASLPEWAQHVSAFFPGRYAVEALHACVAGGGLGATPYSLIALAIIGAAGAIAGAKLFRWDAETRFAAQEGRGWIAVALAAWVAVGVIAEARGGVLLLPPLETTTAVTPQGTGAVPRGGSAPAPAEETPPAPEPVRPPAPEAGSPAAAAAPTPRPSSPGADTRPAKPKPGAAPQPEPSEADTARPLVPTSSRSWRDVTAEEIDREIAFERLPPDAGVVTPIAPADEEPDMDVAAQLELTRSRLPDWPPGQVTDPVQRVRNYLLVAAVPDVFQDPLERYVPHVIFERLEADIPAGDLMRILYWIAIHPMDGDDSAVDELRFVGLGNGPSDMEETRQRVAIYAVKLLGRLRGKLPRG